MSKKLVAAVAEKPRWESTLEQSVRNWGRVTKASSTDPVLRCTAQHSLTFQAYSCACSSWWSLVAPSVGKAVVSDLSNADPKSLCVCVGEVTWAEM